MSLTYILLKACIITDGDLNIIAEGPDMCVRHTQDELKKMDQWCTTHHGQVL